MSDFEEMLARKRAAGEPAEDFQALLDRKRAAPVPVSAPSAEDQARGTLGTDQMAPGFLRDAKEKAISVLGGLNEGAHFGLTGERQGLEFAGLTGLASVVDDPKRLLEPKKLYDNLKQVYTAGRDSTDQFLKASETLNPKTYGASEFAGGFIPTAGLPVGAAAGKAGQFLAKGAVQGGLNAFGHSNADSVSGLAADTAMGVGAGAVFDKAGRFVGNKLQKGAGWFKNKAAKAIADQLDERASSKGKEAASKIGELGKKAADSLRGREVMKSNAPDVEVFDPALAAEMREALTDPASQERLRSAIKNYLPRMKQGLQDITTKEEELAEIMLRDPAKEAAEKLAHPFKDQVFPRLKTYATRSLVPMAGTAVGTWIGNELADSPGAGGMIGAGLGGVTAAAMGAPSTSFANMVKNPATRKMASEFGERVLGKASNAVNASVMPTVREFTDDPEKFQGLVQWLRSRDAAK